MNFSDTGRLIVSILTVLTFLICLGLAIFAFTISQVGLAITALVLSVGFGYFVYNDYMHYFKHQG